LITVSINGVDVLKLLSIIAADTSSIVTWLEQPHIILIPSRDKISLVNKTKHLTPILAVVFVLLGNVVSGHTIKVWWVEELHLYAP